MMSCAVLQSKGIGVACNIYSEMCFDLEKTSRYNPLFLKTHVWNLKLSKKNHKALLLLITISLCRLRQAC